MKNFRIFLAEEDGLHENEWLRKSDNEHLGSDSGKIARKLRRTQKLQPGDMKHIRDYAEDGSDVNSHIHEAHHKGVAIHPAYHEMVDRLDKISNRPIGHHLHAYSGTTDPRQHMNDQHIMHNPAYTSLSHEKREARYHAGYADRNSSDIHMLHVHLKPTDKAGFIGGGQHESLLPRHSQLAINPKPSVFKTDESSKKLHVWHATVHHQD